jgi:YfiH family protein
MISHADCQAAIFYDPIQKAIANVHSGWRGNIQNIYASTILKMQQMYGSKPQNLLVCISPSLGPQSAEFTNFQNELPEAFWKFRTPPHHFDFWQISQYQLEESGVLPSHIQIAEIDTLSNPQDYFSYRHSKICGRNATVCALKSL